MVLIDIPVGNEIKKVYYDGYLKNALDSFKRYVQKKEQDNSFVVCGREGRGKTTLAIQICKYYDPTFDEFRIFTDADKLINALRNAQEFQAFLYDEAQGFTSRAALSKFNRKLVHILSMLRVKRLFLGFCIPSFFELEKYAAIHRTEFLLEVRSEKGKWGFFKYWSWRQKKELYLLGKKTYNYKAVKPYFQGRFTQAFLVNKEIYDKNKKESIEKSLENEREKAPTFREKLDYNITKVLIGYLNKFYSYETIREILMVHNAELSLMTIMERSLKETKRWKAKNIEIDSEGKI